MQKMLQKAGSLLDGVHGVHRRFSRSRPGSVLILVVVLVVLLALMGTALLSTTRSDRYTATQNAANTQIDIIVEGVKQIAQGIIADDTFGKVGNVTDFRPGTDSYSTGSASSSYEAYDAVLMIDPASPPSPYNARLAADQVVANDRWLAPRIPLISSDSQRMYWPALAMLPTVSKFDSPFAVNTSTGAYDPTLSTTYNTRLSTGQTDYRGPAWIQPTGSNEVFPSWFLPGNRAVLAADADGDGIADSGFMKLPFGEIDGVTYYWAVRIVDQNSAINVNTALSQRTDFDFNYTGDENTYYNGTTGVDTFGIANNPATDFNNLGAYRSHVGLMELLNDATNSYLEIHALNRFRADATNTDWPALSIPVQDDQAARLSSNEAFQTLGQAFESQLARRVENPGYRKDPSSSTAYRYKAFSIADSVALAYHNVLLNIDTPPSSLELTAANANPSTTDLDPIYERAGNHPNTASPAAGRSSYPADKPGYWYSDNFNFPGVNAIGGSIGVHGRNTTVIPKIPSIRSIITTYSTTSNQAPYRGIAGALMPGMKADKPTGQPKANVNTSPFDELWRAYWGVMAESSPTGTPFSNLPNVPIDPFEGMGFASGGPPFAPAAGTGNNQMMFRSSIRDVRGAGACVYFDNKVQLQVRAAIAATQTMQIREPHVQQKSPSLAAPLSGISPASVNVKVFGTAPQPFITEVFAWNNDSASATPPPGPAGELPSTKPYIAVELYNPYSVAVPLTDLVIYAIERLPTSTYPVDATDTTKLVEVARFSTLSPLPADLPAYSYVVLENYAVGDSEVTYRPPSTGGVTGTSVHVPNLEMVADKEMIIVRNPTPTNHLEDQPIDSFDFTGFELTRERWSYSRGTEGPAGSPTTPWMCVYPGRYNAGGGIVKYRQQGTQHFDTWPASDLDPGASPGEPVLPTLGKENTQSTLPTTFQIQLNATDFGGPNGGTTKAPFGRFMRDGDILQVPFIGGYIIYGTNASGNIEFYELNSPSMDAAFAEDTDISDDPGTTAPPDTEFREQLGRFCPVDLGSASTVQDFTGTPQSASNAFGELRYAWAMDLFDYLTVQSPASDYVPDVPNPNGSSLIPYPVDNDGDGKGARVEPAATDLDIENSLSVQGKININTAPWRVLAAIPWTSSKNDDFAYNIFNGAFTAGAQNSVSDNEDIARAIVAWRDGDTASTPQHAPQGPFRSIFDLYKVTDRSGVPIFRFIQKTLEAQSGGEPDDKLGDFSPYNSGAVPLTGPARLDRSRYDFEENFLQMTKVSNLITTHSDSFVVYIVVQGWQGVGGQQMPKLVVQRRAAFIQDRSTATKANPNLPAAVNVPND